MRAGLSGGADYLDMVIPALRNWAAAQEAQDAPREARTDDLAFIRAVMVDEESRAVVVDDFTRLFVSAFGDCFRARRHFSFSAPPGLGKSSLARMLTLRRIGQSPHLRSVVISADERDAQNSVSLCRQVVVSPQFRGVFPDVETDTERSMDSRGWKQGEWYLRTPGQRKDPTMQGVSSMPRRESMRVDMLLADDIVTEATHYGEMHERIVSAFFKTWVEGRLSNGGWCCYLQNVRGRNDLLHRLRTAPKFCSVWVGVNEAVNGMTVRAWNPPPDMEVVAHPERFGLTVREPALDEPRAVFEADMTLPARQGWTREQLLLIEAGAFMSLYRQRGHAPEDLMFPSWSKMKREPMTVARMLDIGESGGLPTMRAEDGFRFRISAGLDISGQTRRGMAFASVARDSLGRVVPMELWCRRCSLHETVVFIDESWNRGLRFEQLVVESNGVQSTIREAIRDLAKERRLEWADRVVSFVTGANKWDVQLGLPALDVWMQTETLVWPGLESSRGMAHCATWRSLEGHFQELTRDATRNTTPDELMAFWFATDGLRRLGMPGVRVAPSTGRLILGSGGVDANYVGGQIGAF